MYIKNLVESLLNKYGTNNPFLIANALGIIVKKLPLGSVYGFQLADNGYQVIVVNSNLKENTQLFVCAHELGHAILHKSVHTNYLKYYSFFSTDKIERQAHKFAVEMILSDSYLKEYPDCSIYQLAFLKGIPENLVELKLK